MVSLTGIGRHQVLDSARNCHYVTVSDSVPFGSRQVMLVILIRYLQMQDYDSAL